MKGGRPKPAANAQRSLLAYETKEQLAAVVVRNPAVFNETRPLMLPADMRAISPGVGLVYELTCKLFDEFGSLPEESVLRAEVRQALETLLAEREEREARQAEEEARWRAQREELARQHAELDRQREAEDAQRRAEREELARWRAAENARRQQETEAKARAEEEARQRDERTAKAARTKKPAKTAPLAAIKDALAAGSVTGPEAIDQAYQLGFAAGAQTARQAA